MTGEEVIGVADHCKTILAGERSDEFLNLDASTEFIIGTLNEQFWFGAIQKIREIGIIDREAEADKFRNARI